jgi:WXG100 family type VII secretion target
VVAPIMTLKVDADGMTNTVSDINHAVTRLGSLRERLESVHKQLQSSGTVSQDGDADNKFESFSGRWKDEFEIFGDMLGKFKEALTKAADAYRKADQQTAQAIRSAGAVGGSGGSGGGGAASPV